MFLLNTLFEAGAVTHSFLSYISQATRGSLTAIITSGYGVLGLLVYVGGLYYWSTADPGVEDSEYDSTTESIGEASSQNNESIVEKPDQGEAKVLAPVTNEQVDGPEPKPSSDNQEEDTVGTKEKETEEDLSIGDRRELLASAKLAAGDDINYYVIVAERRPREQLTSLPCFLVLVFFVLYVWATDWNLKPQRDFLAYLVDDEQNNKYVHLRLAFANITSRCVLF
jgi:hypothetical protein